MDASSPNSNTFIPPSPPTPEPPPSNTKKPSSKVNKKTFVLFGLILFMIGAIGVGLFLINQQQSTTGKAAFCEIDPVGGEGGWRQVACGPEGPGAKTQPDNIWLQYNCKDCRQGGFQGNVDPRQGPLGKYAPGEGVVRYKCPVDPNAPFGKQINDWFANGCQQNPAAGEGRVDENFCGLQQIDKSGTFYSYWNVTDKACKVPPVPTPTTPTGVPSNTPTPTTPTGTPTNTPTPTTPTGTPTNTPTVTPTNTPTPTGILTPTPTGTLTPTPTGTLTPTVTPTPTEIILAKSTPTSTGAPVTQAPTIPSAGSQAGTFFMVAAGLILMTLLFVF